MDISFIVCSKDRSASLMRCLRTIFEIKYAGSWEIIVVDNGSSDDTPAVLDTMATLSPVPFLTVTEPLPGNSHGRNAGIARARGEILVFTDDDCLVTPNLLDEMSSIFADERIGYVGGRILLYNKADYPGCIMDVAFRLPVDPGSIVYPGLVQGSNMAFRRRALEEVGYFDPVFGAGAPYAGEDLELATRISLAGWQGGYFPGPVVYHNHGRNRASIERSQRQYDFGIGAYYAKFLLARPTRRLSLMTWTRRSVKQLFKHPLGVPRQVRGALHYIRLHRHPSEG